ncbi:MAG: glycosyltransferase, partial [Lysobacterales bacterium]
MAAWSELGRVAGGHTYLGPAAHAEAAAARGFRVLQPCADMAEAVRALAAAALPGDRLLVALAAELPAYASQRIADFAAHTDADVITVLGADDAALSPLSAALAAFDNRSLDALCHWLGEPRPLPVPRPSPLCALWREHARREFAASPVASGEWPESLICALLPNLFVGVQAKIACALPAPAENAGDPPPVSMLADLRLRLAAVDSAYPQTYPGVDQRPVLLHVLHGWGGGIERFVRDLACDDDRHIHLALRSQGSSARRCHGEVLALAVVDSQGFHPLREWPLPLPITDTAISDGGYRVVLDQLLGDFGVSAVLVSSLIGHSLDVLATGLPTSYVCHDYYPLWPVLHTDFGDAGQAFDAGHMAAAIVAAAGDAAFPFADRPVAHWQGLRLALVERLRERRIALVAPSQTVRSNWTRIEPALAGLDFAVIGHGFARFAMPAPPRPDPQHPKLRLLVLGRIHGGKAEQLLLPAVAALTEHAELWLLGCGAAGQALFGRSGVHIVLDYQREELPALIAAINPDAALLPATVAESFSYTLSELWALGVVPVASWLGSFAERIEPGRTGLLFEPNVAALVDCVRSLAADRAPLAAIRAQLPEVQQRSPAEARAEHLALLGGLPARSIRRTALQAHDLARAHSADRQNRLQQTVQRQGDALAAAERELLARAEWAMASEREVKRIRKSQQGLQQAHDRLADENDRLGKEYARLANEYDRLGNEFEQRSAWALALDQENQQLRDDLLRALDNYQRLEQEKRVADAGWAAEVARVEGLRQELLASSSWRLTRPLRAAAARLRLLRARLSYLKAMANSAPARLARSLRSRGWRGTWQRIADRAEQAPQARAPADITVSVGDDGDSFADFDLAVADAPLASVVIPVYNKFAYTRACLQSIAAHGAGLGFEVIVVDDCSSDQTETGLARIGGLRVIRNALNLGFIGACNAGAAAALGTYLVFLNNDTQVTAGWLDALIGTFDEHPRVGLVGAKLVYPDGRLQEAGGIVFADASGWNVGRFEDPADPAYNYVREVDYCSGAAIAVRRDWFAEHQGFDTRYAPAYY